MAECIDIRVMPVKFDGSYFSGSGVVDGGPHEMRAKWPK